MTLTARSRAAIWTFQRAQLRRPGGGVGGDQVGLRSQDHAVVEHLEAVGLERGAGGGDVDDQLGEAGGRRALGGAEALDDAVAGDALLGEEAARQARVLGGDAHAAAVQAAEGERHLLQVRHAAHVEPAGGHGDDDVGAAEAQRLQEAHALAGVLHGLADQVLAGDAEVRRAALQELRDLGGGDEVDLDARQGRRSRPCSRARGRCGSRRGRPWRARRCTAPSGGPWRAARG